MSCAQTQHSTNSLHITLLTLEAATERLAQHVYASHVHKTLRQVARNHSAKKKKTSRNTQNRVSRSLDIARSHGS
jgi:galactokinase/mevalonate kinase-like predicted kinase